MKFFSKAGFTLYRCNGLPNRHVIYQPTRCPVCISSARCHALYDLWSRFRGNEHHLAYIGCFTLFICILVLLPCVSLVSLKRKSIDRNTTSNAFPASCKNRPVWWITCKKAPRCVDYSALNSRRHLGMIPVAPSYMDLYRYTRQNERQLEPKQSCLY